MPARVSGDRPPGRFVIAAASAGSIFPTEPFTFTIHSIFRSALNLRITPTLPLISLVADTRHAHPRGVVVPCSRFDTWSLERCLRGSFDGNCLSFDVTDAPRVLIGHSRSDAEERAPEIVPSADLSRALSRAATLVASGRQARGSAPIFLGTELEAKPDAFTALLRASASKLSPAFELRSISAALYTVERLIGLGSGLTPAGDDFLCGFLTARQSLAHRDGRDLLFLDDFGRALRSLLRQTNEISAAFLASAADGRFSAALIAFAHAVRSTADPASLSAQSEDTLHRAISTLCSIGHGSGLDAAEGFLYGLSTEGGSQYDN
jgi:hypothetical protein